MPVAASHDVDDVGAADARRRLEEIPAAVLGAANELGVRDAAHQAQRRQHLAIDRHQRLPRRGGLGHGAGREDAALVRDAEGRRAVLVRGVEDDVALPDQRVDVEDIAFDEALEQVERAPVAERVERRPQLLDPLDAGDADGRRVRARLEHPGAGHAFGKPAHLVVVHRVDELGHEHALVPRLDAHRQLVAEIPRRRLAHPGDPQVLAQQRRRLDVEVVERDDAVDHARCAPGG